MCALVTGVQTFALPIGSASTPNWDGVRAKAILFAPSANPPSRAGRAPATSLSPAISISNRRCASVLAGRSVSSSIRILSWIGPGEARMVDLKLPKLPDRTPVKIAISVMPDVFEALNAYADAYEAAYGRRERSEENTSELQSLLRIS